MENATFTPQTTRQVLETASEAAGVDPRGAELVRMGENAMFRLATAPIIARVGRSVTAARKETRVASWLAAHQMPAVRLAPTDREFLAVGDLVVTFWEFIEESDQPVTSGELGDMLRRLHAIPEPSDLALPFFEPMPKVESRLKNIGSALSDDERAFLSSRKAELDKQFASLSFQLGFGPVHGDYHKANLMRDHSGTVRVIDFEDFCWGPREWDACVEAVRYQAMGWVSNGDYTAYIDAYGFDPLEWPGFPVIRAIRELNMTTWLAQQTGQSPEVDDEVRKRIKDLRDSERPRHWRTF
ncbi:aminoglycoside phosphotransferase family protein [Saccharopolyspora sp. HNM0986]|uniref:phosphotransferase enzyme family protein n=1 Tax=Saccharopolyspora galaxeae TaxID=2781241 RepID=UPI00190B7CC9|nr:aminoglycoside phosphotransferase family protein [Saccharopolyspora sp. HNM0986]MBK0866164.1 aminoglycoside phosphotransferase family protein [Saccharopolyspora sp. HNM0986]